MNKKLLVSLVISLVLLSGCSNKNYTKDTFAKEFEESITVALESDCSSFQNRSKGYYSYYLPLTIGHRGATKSADILVCDQKEVLMSINASAIISSEYYSESATYLDNVVDKDAYYSNSFSTRNQNGDLMRILFTVYDIDDEYYMIARTRFFYYLTRARLDELSDIAKDVISISRTTTVNKDAVVMAYSSKEIIDYDNQQMYSIFAQNAPERGTLKEMLINYYEVYESSYQEDNPEIDKFNEQTTGDYELY